MWVAINSNSVPVYATESDPDAIAYCPRCGKCVQVRENKYGTFWKHVDSFDAKMCAADKEEKIRLLRERVSYLQSQYEIQQQMTHEAKVQVKELENELEETRRGGNVDQKMFVCSDTSGGIGTSPPETKLQVYKITYGRD
jgi:hypothetical protein